MKKSSDPIIEVDQLATRFGKNYVHKSVSFKVERASVVAIIGGSGAGKSVLLKAIIGLLKPDKGTVKIFGQDVCEASSEQLFELRSRFGVLFQNGALFSALNVGDNLALPLREHCPEIAKDQLDQLVRLALGLSGLSADTALKMPSDLSGGMRKRAALARALALVPELLFLDEPTSGLDPINARAFDSLIRTLCDSLQITVVMITHDLDTLAGIVDQVIILGEGKILAQGTVAEVRRSEIPWVKEYFEARPEFV